MMDNVLYLGPESPADLWWSQGAKNLRIDENESLIENGPPNGDTNCDLKTVINGTLENETSAAPKVNFKEMTNFVYKNLNFGTQRSDTNIKTKTVVKTFVSENETVASEITVKPEPPVEDQCDVSKAVDKSDLEANSANGLLDSKTMLQEETKIQILNTTNSTYRQPKSETHCDEPKKDRLPVPLKKPSGSERRKRKGYLQQRHMSPKVNEIREGIKTLEINRNYRKSPKKNNFTKPNKNQYVQQRNNSMHSDSFKKVRNFRRNFDREFPELPKKDVACEQKESPSNSVWTKKNSSRDPSEGRNSVSRLKCNQRNSSRDPSEGRNSVSRLKFNQRNSSRDRSGGRNSVSRLKFNQRNSSRNRSGGRNSVSRLKFNQRNSRDHSEGRNSASRLKFNQRSPKPFKRIRDHSTSSRTSTLSKRRADSHSRNYSEPSRKKAYSDIVNNKLDVVIINESHPEGVLTLRQSDLVIDNLITALVDYPATSADNIPRFQGYGLVKGILTITCLDENSLEWLKNNPLLDIFDNAKLKVIRSTEFARLTRITAFIPGPIRENADILKLLKKQNKELNTHRWRIYHRGEVQSGISLILGVDDASIAVLTSLDLQPYYGMGRASFYLGSKREKPRNFY